MVRSTLSSATSELTIRNAGPEMPGSCQVVVGEERIRHRLVDAEAQQDTAQMAAARLHRRKVAVHCRLRHGLADLAVAVLAGHLFDDVDFARAVESPRRDADAQRIRYRWHANPRPAMQLDDLVARQATCRAGR